MQAVGKLVVDILLPIEDTIESYYLLDKFYILEDAMKEVIGSYKNTYEANRTLENAKKLNYSIELLYEVNRLGAQYAKEYAKLAIAGDNRMDRVFQCMDKKILGESEVIDSLFDSLNDKEQKKDIALFNRIMEAIKAENEFLAGYDSFVEIAYRAYNKEKNSNNDDSGEGSESDTIIQDVLEVWYTEAEEVQESSKRISNFNINSNLTLARDLEFYGDLNISSGKILDLNGYTLKIFGNWNHKGTLNVNGGTIVIGCDAVISGNVNIGGGSLIIGGNVLHSAGVLNINKGNLKIEGDYRNQSKSVDEDGVVSYKKSNGYMYMANDKDSVTIKGDMYVQYNSYESYDWSAGTLTLSGDLT